MEIKLQSKHILFIIIGILILIIDFIYFLNERWFKPVIIIGFVVMVIQFFLDFLAENKRQQEIETKFLEFVRALVETVKSGIPIPKAIIQISTEDYGALTPHVKKMAAQIEWGFPLDDVLEVFANDAKNKVINKSISIVTEAEKSGGNMAEVLQAVSNSVYSIKKIKEERKSSVYSQVVQGYIIFFIFIAIMLMMQVYLMPKISNLGGEELSIGSSPISGVPGISLGSSSTAKLDEKVMASTFTWMVLIQGLFAGLLIGKFSEGELKYGVKHSLIFVIVGYLIISTVSWTPAAVGVI
ncbi:MAG: type II secretion system F family protein [Candidatus Nanoarchaeia archaeon]|nr:type II secretion system F family protein [Candidatus Nanoarchaeia archaeon]MDD5587560.1 type II secretion system F family protein [Candidatus Nanoarchaeia archaeon]